jgi:WD40 repeat protein
MTDFASFLAGGESDDPAIVPGDPAASYLIEEITPVDGVAEMPKKDDPLHATQIELVTRWIAEGAKDDTPESAKVRFTAENPPTYVGPPALTALDYSPDGKFLAVSGFHEVLLHKADGSGLVARLVGLSERIESVAFSPDGSKLAVTGGSPGRMGEVQVWDVAKHTLDLSVSVTYDTVFGASWSPDGSKIAFGCTDTTVRAIDAKNGSEVLFMGSHNDWAIDTVFSMAGDYLVSVGRDMTAKLTKVDEQRFIDNITSITPGALKGGILSVVRHPKRDEVLFGGADGIAKIYRTQRVKKREIGDDSNQLWNLPPLDGRIFAVDWSRNGKLIAAGSSLDGNGQIGLFGIDPDYQVPGNIDGIIKKPTQNRNGDEKKKLAEYFAKGIKTIAKVDTPSPIYALAFRPDGKQLAAAAADGQVRLYDTTKGGQIKSFSPLPAAK